MREDKGESEVDQQKNGNKKKESEKKRRRVNVSRRRGEDVGKI